MIYVFIDPGYAITGFAVFDVHQAPLSVEAAKRGLVEWGSWQTKPKETKVVRLLRLGRCARDLAARCTGARWVIEEPADPVVYQRNRGRGRNAAAAIADGMASLHGAIGALTVGAATGGAAVQFVKAPGTRKGMKQLQANWMLPAKTTSRTNEHVRDAVWLGGWWLTRGAARTPESVA